MKTKTINLLKLSSAIFVMVAYNSCSQDSDLQEYSMQEPKISNVRLSVNKIDFDSQETTRTGGSGTGWVNGETIYLRFDNTTTGTAVYVKSSDSWNVKLNGSFLSTTGGKLEAYYFDRASAASSGKVTLDATKAIYRCTDGVYGYTSDGELEIGIILKPLTGRIRFAGISGMGITVEGLKYHTGYDVANNSLTVSTDAISGKVASNGYTPYYYCEFANNNRQLSVTNTKDNTLHVKSFTSSVLKVGESGYLTIPTEANNKGWEDISSQEFTVTGNGKTIKFKMRLVVKGTFQMGSTDGNSNEMPVHNVTLSKDYYIGETEVTQGLWYAVMGQKPTADGEVWSYYGVGDDYPAYYISYEDCKTFLTKLNQMTGKNFRFPTEAEWEFAARGGIKSNGYEYAGSNSIDDVAWYDGNSGRTSHVVKTKAANEIGLYDMSGNVEEWCYDWYDSYSSSSQTDPTGPTSGSRRMARGGSWWISSICRVTCRQAWTPNFRYGGLGFRLAL